LACRSNRLNEKPDALSVQRIRVMRTASSMSRRRVASARPPHAGAARSSGHGPKVGLRARELWRALLDGFKQHDLLTYSSAISFQIVTAAVPFVMFVLALAGLLHFDGVWRNHWPRRSLRVSRLPCSA
jgi:hypothetical protein